MRWRPVAVLVVAVTLAGGCAASGAKGHTSCEGIDPDNDGDRCTGSFFCDNDYCCEDTDECCEEYYCECNNGKIWCDINSYCLMDFACPGDPNYPEPDARDLPDAGPDSPDAEGT